MTNKRTVLLICVAVVLAALYLRFSDVWKQKSIHIIWRVLPQRSAAQPTVQFFLDKPYALTSVKVVSTDAALTNKFAHPLWFLVAASNPPTTKGFTYGAPIPGMQPDIPNTTAEPLRPDTSYAITIQAGKSLSGKVNFHL